MEKLLTLETLIVAGPFIVAFIIFLARSLKFKKELNTVIKIIEVVAKNHDIKAVDILDEIIDKAQELTDNTEDIEKEAEKEKAKK